MEFEYDAFICHASEDKSVVAEPLAQALLERNHSIWLDSMTLRIGDNLRRKIDEGLSKSRYGIVILSPDFFRKEWTAYELDGLVAREMADGVKVILPIWHSIGSSEIRQYSMALSMRLAGQTSIGIVPLADDLSSLFNETTRIKTPEIKDELALAKQVILNSAFQQRNQNRVLIQPASMNRGKAVCVGNYCYNDSERQRKLFLYALEQLEQAGLVEFLSDSIAELTYPGIQAAERMETVQNPELVGL